MPAKCNPSVFLLIRQALCNLIDPALGAESGKLPRGLLSLFFSSVHLSPDGWKLKYKKNENEKKGGVHYKEQPTHHDEDC